MILIFVSLHRDSCVSHNFYVKPLKKKGGRNEIQRARKIIKESWLCAER